MPKALNKGLQIAMLGHKRIPSREGGIEIVVGELSTRMASYGYNVTCFNRKGDHIAGNSFNDDVRSNYQGVSLKSVWTLDKRGLAAMTSSFFAAIASTFGGYDVIHFHAEGPCAMMWLPKLFGKKCIATIHGLDHQRSKWGRFASWYILFGEKCAVRFADEIIVLSKNVQNYFYDTYGRETVYIPNGVTRPENVSACEIVEKYNLKKDDYILFLGRLVPEKGVKYLIDAFNNVKTNKKLVIAGAASDSDVYAQELIEMAAEDDRIIFTGFVQGNLLAELYSNSYVYVLPSDLEGMPLSLLEALSYGNCCLTSDIPECADVIGKCGLTFKKGDIIDLKNKLQFLCDDYSFVESFKNQAADFVCNKYNWDEITKQTLKLYGVNEDLDFSAPVEEKEYESAIGK